MKYCIYLFLSFITIKTVHAQNNIISIHPEIGDTISLSEKINFKLFPKIQSIKYSYAIVYQVKESYYLNVFYSDNTFSAKEIDKAVLSSYFENIEKQITDSTIKENNDNNLNIRPLNHKNENSKGDRLISPETRKKIGYTKIK